MDQDLRPRRSVLYMPGANERALEKAKGIPADALIFDLEDAVSPDAKPEASFLGFTHARLEQVQARMRRSGPWVLLVNRFLPGIRGVVFIAAGAAHMPRRNALLLGAVSAMAHTGLVLTLASGRVAATTTEAAPKPAAQDT